MGKTEVQTLKIDRLTAAFFIFLAVSLFLAYPRALIYPPGVSNDAHVLNWLGASKVSLEDVAVPFFVRFPVEILIGAVSLFYICSSFLSFKQVPRKTVLSIILFLLAVAGSVIVNGALPEQVLLKLCYALVPLAVAFGALKSGLLGSSREWILLISMTLLWSVSITWSFISDRPVGISGNRNWFVTVLIVTSPWAYFVFYHFFRISLKRFFTHVNENFIAAGISLLIILPMTFYWIKRSESRAAWFSLAVYLAFILIMKFKLKNRLLITGALAVVIGISAFVSQKLFKEAYIKDIRGPLWLNTLSMIKQSPGIGHGPGKFLEKYTQFKSHEHSSRLVAADMTEHPHSEVLYIAAELGIPSALIWLSIMFSLMFIKVRSREGHLAKFGFIILLTCSFFDKALISPPGNLLFWIFGGLLAARWLKGLITFEEAPKMWKLSILLVSLCCAVPVWLRASTVFKAGEIHRKTALLEQSIAQSKLSGGQRKDLYLKVYDGYLSAYDKNPFQVEYPYLALHIAVEILKDPSLAEFPLKRCLDLNRRYGHVNYLAALYHFQKSKSAGLKKQQSEAHLAEADKFILAEISLFSHHLASLSHALDFFIKTGNRNLANQVFGMINDNALNKYRLKFPFAEEDGRKLLSNWVKDVTAGKDGAAAVADEILRGIKGIDGIDVLTPYYAAQEGYFLEHNHNKFHKVDFTYWREIALFSELYRKVENAESLSRQIMDSISIQDSQVFRWPSEVLEAKTANELSLACLLRVAAHCQGHLSFLVKVQTLDKVFWMVGIKNEKEEFICWPGRKKIFKKKIGQFLQDSTFIEDLIGDKIKSKGLYLFEYPQAFCFRNVLLSKIVNRINGNFPDFCSSPSVVKLNLESYLGGRWRIDYLRQPFLRLEEDVKKGGR